LLAGKKSTVHNLKKRIKRDLRGSSQANENQYIEQASTQGNYATAAVPRQQINAKQTQ
jgi:hypothetical protein